MRVKALLTALAFIIITTGICILHIINRPSYSEFNRMDMNNYYRY